MTTIIELFRSFIGRICEFRERMRKSSDNFISKRGKERADFQREFVEDEIHDLCGRSIAEGCGKHKVRLSTEQGVQTYRIS